MSQSIFAGPIASQNNPPIEPQWFEPSRFDIDTLTYGTTTSVTTSDSFGVENNYVVGQLVRFDIPPPFGARQLDGKQAYVLTTPSTNTFTVGINTTQGYDPFIAVPTHSTTPAQVAAIGDINSGVNNTGRSNNATTIQGAFINISPSAGG